MAGEKNLVAGENRRKKKTWVSGNISFKLLFLQSPSPTNMQSDAEIFLRSQEAGVIQAEHESLKQRVKMLEDSLNVCFLIFTKMGFQPNEIRNAKQTVRAGHVPDLSVQFHLMDPSSLGLDFSFQMPAPAFGAHFTSPTSSHGASASSSASSTSIGTSLVAAPPESSLVASWPRATPLRALSTVNMR